MNIKKNKNGFTLVELVVVVCIFGIILAAILNFIKPANEIHNDVQATRDANVISSGLIEYMDDELRYATNVLVLQDYLGVPAVTDSGYVGNYNVPFTGCFVIDNVHFRGFGTPGYSDSDDDTAAKRMGATGQILRVNNIDTNGFDLNNSSVVKGEDFYDTFRFNISVGTNIESNEALQAEHLYDSSVKTLQMNVVTSFPVWENGSYVFKKKFDRGSEGDNEAEKTKDRGAVLNLTNINIDPHDNLDLEVVKFNSTLNPAQSAGHQSALGYPPASSAPAGVTASQAAFYGASASRYTYIFYRKTGKRGEEDSGTCSIKFVTDTPNPNTAVGSTITGFTKGDVFKSFPSVTPISGYSSHYWIAPDKSQVDPDVGYPINADTTFKLIYVKDPEPSPFEITWINADGTSYTTPGPVPVGKTATNGPPTGFDTSKKALNEATGGWVEQGTGKSYLEVPIDKNVTFVADLVDKYPVHFKYSDSDIKDGEPVVSGKYAVAPDEHPSAPEGKQFDKWVVSGDTSKDIASTPITKETTFVPTFKDKPAGVNGWTVSYTASTFQMSDSFWNGSASVPFTGLNLNLSFTCTDPSKSLKAFKVKVTFDAPTSVYYSSNVTITGDGTKTLTFSPMLWGNIQNGGSHNLNNSPFRTIGGNVVKVELVSATNA